MAHLRRGCSDGFGPARLELRPGFTAFIGPNNSGKSALLRLFYELRPFFANAMNISYLNQMVLSGNLAPVAQLPPEVLDFEELFSFTNDHAISISVLPYSGPLIEFPPVIILQRYRELGPYDKLGGTQPSWGKTDNWRVAAEMTRDELLRTDLGRFLEQI